MRKTWLVCALLIVGTASGCGGCGDKETATTPPSTEATPEVSEPVTPADPVLQALTSLHERARSLPGADAADQAPRAAFKREGLILGNNAIEDMRLDVVVGVAEVLWRAGEGEAAAAFLQRSVGITREKTTEKQHMHALARLKVELGGALEAASLMERAIDIEPTTSQDFVLLSWAYLRAGRLGPAAAATRRAARGHEGDPDLAVQAAEVMLIQSDAASALAALDAIQPQPTSEHFLRVHGEAQLISGNREGAAADAKALVSQHPESPWGPLLTSALGGVGRADAQGAAARLSAASLAAVDGRAALSWAEAAGDLVSAWERTTPVKVDESAEGVPKAP